MSDSEKYPPVWRRPAPEDPALADQMEHAAREHLTLDPRYPLETDQAMLRPMQRSGRMFWLVFVILSGLVIMLFTTWLYQMIWGLGITGLNRPVMWMLYIANFVYFIGIGHAGTFISAALRVLKFEFRRPISRAAETVTVFALLTASLFPLIHIGRAWKFYYLIPFPNQRELWPSYHSPLIWDATAIFTYLSCSILFAYIGLLPDLAMARDHTTGWRQRFFKAMALGWRGTTKEWTNQETALNVFSYAIIPVMFSVHTIVSWDFAMALQPGWHSTIFGPYFVVGALFSGAGAVIMVLAVIRKAMHLEYFIRKEHFAGMAMFLLILSLTWDYFFFNDYIVPWYGQEPVEKSLSVLLTSGRWAVPFWLMIFSNTILPAATLWSKRVRTSPLALFIVGAFIQVGMWLERFIIIPVTLGQNWLPFDWGTYTLHLPEALITIGSFAFFGLLYLLFTRFFPVIPVWEVLEGQLLQTVRRIGRALVPSRSEE